MKDKLIKHLNIFKLNKKSVSVIGVFVFLGLFLAAPAFAGWAVEIIGGLLGMLISGIGLILVLAINTLVKIAQYSHFINSGAVSNGWVVVRDFANMFFVVILLVIAFGTILNIEKYNYKKWLPKLIMMAVLINFSKTICGIFIDIAQIVMLTFVNSFSNIGSGSLINILGITDILQLDKDGSASFWSIVGAYLLGLIYVIVSLIVIVTMIAMLAIRIVMIWIYVVLSPLAYLLAAFPGGQSYASRWWSEFTKNLIIGPVLAFFIWLSFVSLQNVDHSADYAYDTKAVGEMKSTVNTSGDSASTTNDIGTVASTPSALIKFVIAIGMLVGGLKIAQEFGGAAGSMAGKGMNSLNKAGKIGMAGAAAITGVRAAKGIAKNYQAHRRGRREERYKTMSNNVIGTVGKAKKAVGTGVVGGLQRVRNTFADAKRVENTKQELSFEKDRLEQMQQNFNQKNGKVGRYQYVANPNGKGGSWRDKSNNIVSEDDVNKELSIQQKRVNNKEVKLSGEMDKKKAMDNLLNAGTLFMGNKFKNAGKYDLKAAGMGSDFRLNKIKKEEADLKDEDDRTILAKMDDPSVNAFARAASGLEAMRRGLLSSEKAQSFKEALKSSNKLGGVDDNNNFKDKKVSSYFENIAAQKNISSTKVFEDLKSGDASVRSRAEREVRNNIESGRFNLENLDSSAIRQLGPELARLMKPKDFAAQFSKITDQGKKREIVETLKREVSKDNTSLNNGTVNGKMDYDNAEAKKLEAVKKLAQISDISKATSGITNPENKKEIERSVASDYSFEELKQIMRSGTIEQKQALLSIVANNNYNLDIFENAVNSLNNGSQAAEDLIRELVQRN